MCTDCVAKQCAEGEGATICTPVPAELYQNAVGSYTCTLSAAGLQQDAARKTV